jgi:hypothetical protein
MRHLALLWTLSIAVTATGAAQDQPDFSGRWVLTSVLSVDSNVAQSLTVRQPVARVNAFGAAMEPYFKELIVEREFIGILALTRIRLVCKGVWSGRRLPDPLFGALGGRRSRHRNRELLRTYSASRTVH